MLLIGALGVLWVLGFLISFTIQWFTWIKPMKRERDKFKMQVAQCYLRRESGEITSEVMVAEIRQIQSGLYYWSEIRRDLYMATIMDRRLENDHDFWMGFDEALSVGAPIGGPGGRNPWEDSEE